MKRIAIAAAAALLMLGTAQAQQARSNASPLYGELGYSFLQVKESSTGFDATPQALRGIIGYNFHPYFAAEGMLAIGTSSDSDLGVDAKVKHAFGIFVKPKYDFNNFEVFGRLGWARTKATFSVPGFSASGSDSDFAYGVGVNYNFNPKMYVGADWMQLLDKDTAKVRGWTVSFGYRF
ncbi:porin family protein [Ramlibacter sp. AN1133]|uniref:porin family protein n=1 Tax=Ramlibacter sp. AN1133 TaxID=3133429 RepID=UPI0030BFFB3A